MTAPGELRACRWLRGALLTAAIAMLAGLLVYVALRLTYPFELEWMEGAMVDHASRVRHGLDLYVAPGPDHVQFLYTPLLFYLGALVSLVSGEGFLALRLVSVLSTAMCALWVFLWVRRALGEDRHGALMGWVAAGLLASGYGYLQSWYDLARNDMLMLAALLGTAYLTLYGGRRAVLVAAALGAVAFLAKQTTVMWLPAIVVGALLLDRRKGVLLGGVSAALIGALALGYHLATDGWFTFFVFEMPSHHRDQDGYLSLFAHDLVPLAPMVALALLGTLARLRDRATRPETWFLLAFGGGGLVTSFLSRRHAGGYDNVLVFLLLAGCVLATIAAARAHGRARVLGLSLLLLQFVLMVVDPRCLWQERPALMMGNPRFVPDAAHRQASEELVDYLRAVDGAVLVPFHGHLAVMAGKRPAAHAQAMGDLVQVALDPSGALAAAPHPAAMTFYQSMTARMAEQAYGAIVLDEPRGAFFESLFTIGLAGYARGGLVPLSRPQALQPVVGMDTHSPYVLTPR